MSYVRAQGTVIVSDCPGGAPMSGMGAFGALELDPRGQYMQLEAQINRFLEPSAAADVRLTGAMVPVTGELGAPARIYLQAILTRRAASGIYGNVPADQREVLGQAASVIDPAFVAGNFDAIYALVKGYADSKGLPVARPLPITATTMNKLIVAAVAVGIFMFARGRGGGRR